MHVRVPSIWSGKNTRSTCYLDDYEPLSQQTRPYMVAITEGKQMIYGLCRTNAYMLHDAAYIFLHEKVYLLKI